MPTDTEETTAEQTDTETAGDSPSTEEEGLYANSDDAKNDGDKKSDDSSEPEKGEKEKPDSDSKTSEKDKPEGKEKESDKKDGDDKDSEDEPKGAPEKYEEFTIPEGFERNEDGAKEFGEFAKGLNLTQEQAQKASDYHFERIAAHNENLRDQQEKLREGWVKETKKDKEIGGDDINLKLADAKRVVDNFSPVATDEKGNPVPVLDKDGKETGKVFTEFGLVMAQTGLDNNPAVIRLMYRLSQAVGEDFKNVQHGDTPQHEKTAGETLYPNLKNK